MNIKTHILRRVALFLTLLAVGALAEAAQVRVFVQHAPGQKAAVQAALVQARAQVHHSFDDLDAMAVSLPEAVVAALQRNPAVVLVEEDPVRGFLSQTIPYGVTTVQATDPVFATSPGAGGAGIQIGVVDSGVFADHQVSGINALGHEDLQGVSITGEPDWGPNDERTWYRDVLSHGTHVVGTIVAANNVLGVVGVSPNVSIHMVKVFGDTGNWIYSSDILNAARAAVTHGARIVSMSLGGSIKSRTEERGMADLYNNKGALLVAAAGNSGNSTLSYPASYASVVSVAAVDSTGTVASFSQHNKGVELAAPGVGVLSTVSYADVSSVSVSGGGTYSARQIEFSQPGNVSAPLIYAGGTATTTNSAWNGKAVLVDRGDNSFYEKVQNVQQSGGVACIIANNVSGIFSGTLGSGNSSTIPAVSVSLEDGQVLRMAQGTSVTVNSSVVQPANGYDAFDGTSMATPHVSGVAALIWSKYPGATNAQVRMALQSSALDLGATGRDDYYGYGLVQARAALDQLAGLNPSGPSDDTTAPIISDLTATVTNAKNGSFQITWKTDEPATSDVKINGVLYSNSTLVTDHVRGFRGTKGATYTYQAISTDAAGNTATSAVRTFTNQ